MSEQKWYSLDDRGKLRALIEENAYFRWQLRQQRRIRGIAEDDWLEAERYVRSNWPELFRRVHQQKVIPIAG
jgi:hypothetical protein